jgi:hypothetical protein
MNHWRFAIVTVGCAVVASLGLGAPTGAPPIELFLVADGPDDVVASRSLERIAGSWRNGYASIFVDLLRLRPVAAEPPDPNLKVRRRLVQFLEKQTKQNFGEDFQRWRQWVWRLPYDPHPDYGLAKGEIYGWVDPRMKEFFPPGVRAGIRLDEIDWGGVRVNGIPPLDHPKVLAARDAAFLGNSNVVFGVFLNGEARAYPKRILAWHELARDRVGGVEVTVVYCTLCGAVIPYESVVGGRLRVLGTSGLLYRSNKLMFDDETKSLWSTLEGKPVVGRLLDSGLELKRLPVVTTTWGEWRRLHPRTTVLSLDTGINRDYSEGEAYRDYFATDALMFQVPQVDRRLRNKAEVLAMLLETPDGKRHPVAIAADFLKGKPVYHAQFAGQPVVVVTSPNGANRAYQSRSVLFVKLLNDGRLQDTTGQTWRVDEDALVPESGRGLFLGRIPAQRAFWFGWHAQFPNTELVYK